MTMRLSLFLTFFTFIGLHSQELPKFTDHFKMLHQYGSIDELRANFELYIAEGGDINQEFDFYALNDVKQEDCIDNNHYMCQVDLFNTGAFVSGNGTTTLLGLAAGTAESDLVLELIESGADPLYQMKDGSTAFARLFSRMQLEPWMPAKLEYADVFYYLLRVVPAEHRKAFVYDEFTNFGAGSQIMNNLKSVESLEQRKNLLKSTLEELKDIKNKIAKDDFMCQMVRDNDPDIEFKTRAVEKAQRLYDCYIEGCDDASHVKRYYFFDMPMSLLLLPDYLDCLAEYLEYLESL